MYDEPFDPPDINHPEANALAVQSAWSPRCSMTTFLHRIAFTVWHATLYLERVGQG